MVSRAMSERCHGPIMPPDSLVEEVEREVEPLSLVEVEREVDIFFLDDGSDRVTDANAVTRDGGVDAGSRPGPVEKMVGGRHPDLHLIYT